jgi:hypothetical protein
MEKRSRPMVSTSERPSGSICRSRISSMVPYCMNVARESPTGEEEEGVLEEESEGGEKGMESVSSRYRLPTLERGNTIPNFLSPAIQRRNMSLYLGSKMWRKQVTLGNASVHTKIGVSMPEDEACRSDVSQFARSVAAVGKRV